jgi:hypothetical protein
MRILRQQAQIEEAARALIAKKALIQLQAPERMRIQGRLRREASGDVPGAS